jgi:hypothetical protein
MKLSIARELFQAGVFEQAQIVEMPMEKGWNLLLVGQTERRMLNNDKDLPRVFKTIEAAYRLAKSLGFNEAVIY